jgi:hypothetical protein
MSTPYNTTTGFVGTVTTDGTQTAIVTEFDLASTDGIDYQNCTISVDVDVNGNYEGLESYMKRITALAARTTNDVGFINNPTVTFGPISSNNISPGSVNLVIDGTKLQIVATGVEGYAITWRGELRLRIN